MANPPVIRLHPDDQVVIARATMLPGAPVADGLVSGDRVPSGHKIATRPIAKGEAITQDVSTLENPAILEQLKQSV